MGPWFIKPFVLLLAGLALVAPAGAACTGDLAGSAHSGLAPRGLASPDITFACSRAGAWPSARHCKCLIGVPACIERSIANRVLLFSSPCYVGHTRNRSWLA